MKTQTSATWNELTEAQKKEAVEKIQQSEHWNYPQWHDVSQITEFISEFAENCLGFELKQRTFKTCGGGTGTEADITWSANYDGRDGVGLAGRLLDFAEMQDMDLSAITDEDRKNQNLLPALKELSADSKYGGKTGKSIIESQRALRQAQIAFRSVLQGETDSYCEYSLYVKQGREFHTIVEFESDWNIDSLVPPELKELMNSDLDGIKDAAEAAAVAYSESMDSHYESKLEKLSEELENLFEEYVRDCAGILLSMIRQEIEFKNSEAFLLEEGNDYDRFDHLTFNLENGSVVSFE